MEPALLRVPEAARFLSLGRSKAYQLVASGELPSIRVGNSIRVPVEALQQWVRQQTVMPGSRTGEKVSNGAVA